MTIEKELRRAGVCAFCGNSTHDFPSDVIHDQLHADGWHTCGVDGEFRRNRPLCKAFQLADCVKTSL